MLAIEFKDAARETAFELLDEIKELDRELKMVVCELEDTLYDCFEDSEEEEHEESEEGKDLGFKAKYNRHYAMRNFDTEDDDERDIHHYRKRRSLGMRRRMK